MKPGEYRDFLKCRCDILANDLGFFDAGWYQVEATAVDWYYGNGEIPHITSPEGKEPPEPVGNDFRFLFQGASKYSIVIWQDSNNGIYAFGRYQLKKGGIKIPIADTTRRLMASVNDSGKDDYDDNRGYFDIRVTMLDAAPPS